jgi:nitroreductase
VHRDAGHAIMNAGVGPASQEDETMMAFPRRDDVDFSRRDPAPGGSALFSQRWSPRSFQKQPIPDETLAAIMDAARWAPSSFNEQPWLFVTSSGENDFPLFLGLLLEKNQAWARNASVLGFVFARRNFTHNGQPNRFAAFDSGAAWMALQLQASMFGLYAHGMGGIRRDDIHAALGVPPEEYDLYCGFAIGVIDRPERLPEDVAKNEVPSARRPLASMWRRGKF